MIRNTSAGSSGARRAQAAARRGPLRAAVPGPTAVAVMVVLIGTSPVVLLGDGRGQLLALGQRVRHRHLTGDRRADLLGHLGAQIGELRDVDELDADGRPRLDAGVAWVDAVDRLLGLLVERPGRL